MTIRLNGETLDVDDGSTVTDLLGRLAKDPRTVAVELNGDILPRAQYSDTTLQADDGLEIVQFVQGG